MNGATRLFLNGNQADKGSRLTSPFKTMAAQETKH